MENKTIEAAEFDQVLESFEKEDRAHKKRVVAAIGVVLLIIGMYFCGIFYVSDLITRSVYDFVGADYRGLSK